MQYFILFFVLKNANDRHSSYKLLLEYDIINTEIFINIKNYQSVLGMFVFVGIYKF